MQDLFIINPIKQEIMTQVEYDCAMENIHCRREEEILPIQKAIAALEEKIARCKKEMAELELKRQTLGHEKTLVVARLQEVKAKYHNERKKLLKDACTKSINQ